MTEGDAIHSNAPTAVPATRSKREVFVRRLASAVTLWVLLFAVLLSGKPVAYFLLCAGLGMGGLWEFYGMLDHKRLPNFKLFGMGCAAVFFIGSFSVLERRGPVALSNDFEMAVLLLFLLGVFGRQLFTRAKENIPPLETMAYTVFGLMYVPWLFNYISKIIYLIPRSPEGGLMGQYYVLYLIAVSKFSDMGAYLTGSLIGRHKMVPHISPGKTWEGFGGVLDLIDSLLFTAPLLYLYLRWFVLRS